MSNVFQCVVFHGIALALFLVVYNCSNTFDHKLLDMLAGGLIWPVVITGLDLVKEVIRLSKA